MGYGWVRVMGVELHPKAGLQHPAALAPFVAWWEREHVPDVYY